MPAHSPTTAAGRSSAPQGFRGRVLYVARAPFISGAERALMTMLRNLDRSHVRPHLVLGAKTPLVKQAAELDIPVTIIELVKREKEHWLLWRRSCKRLKRVIREFEPDVLHANDVPSCQAMSVVGAKVGLPRVVHVRWTITAADAGWWMRDGAEAVVCISDWVRGQLGEVKGTPAEGAHVRVIHDAVDWPAEQVGGGEAGGSDSLSLEGESGRGGVAEQNDVFRSSKRAEDAGAVHPSPAPPSREGGREVALGFTGQLIESKGLDLVIEAMGALPVERRPRLLVAGDDTQHGGAYKRQLQAVAERCGVAGDIEWLGFIDDVSDLHRRVDAMVCPSRVEPLGLVPLEAARLRVPTIANRLGGFTETIDDARTGWLVEPTAAAWAAALGRLGDADLRAMGEAARQRTAAMFSPAAYQERLMGLYAALCAGI